MVALVITLSRDKLMLPFFFKNGREITTDKMNMKIDSTVNHCIQGLKPFVQIIIRTTISLSCSRLLAVINFQISKTKPARTFDKSSFCDRMLRFSHVSHRFITCFLYR